MPDEQRYVISVMSVDRVGIIHDITEQILSLRGNIVGLSQTVMRGYFTVLVEAVFPAEMQAADVLDRISKGGRAPGELQVLVTPRQPYVATIKQRADAYVLTARGPDQPGVIHRIASFLAGQDVNFEDLYAYVEQGHFVMIAQVTLPPSLPFERLQIDLEMLGRDSEMEIVLQHENIFRAVNEVRMVGS
jgi:predicted amino acid-binding ACT domain protein